MKSPARIEWEAAKAEADLESLAKRKRDFNRKLEAQDMQKSKENAGKCAVHKIDLDALTKRATSEARKVKK